MRNSYLPGGKGDDAGGWGRGRGPAVCETLRENPLASKDHRCFAEFCDTVFLSYVRF